jgi:hypothetical protein
MRTIAIEICGYDFEHVENQPEEQKVANVLSVVWAVMQRYGIRASNILGHQEIAINNADPGKKFMALMRLLVGVKALVEPDQRMKELVFGQYLSSERQPWQAVEAYFQFVRDYLVMISRPDTVYEWETYTGYWLMHDLVRAIRRGKEPQLPQTVRCPATRPVRSPSLTIMKVDFSAGDQLSTVSALAALGNACSGKAGYHPGKLAIFHTASRMALGSIVYGTWNVAELQAGRTFCPASRLLTLPAGERHAAFRHRYGATWESNCTMSEHPLNVGAEWIKQRYLNPVEYLNQHLDPHERQGGPLD